LDIDINMKKLIDIFKTHNQRIVCKWNHYLEHYERYFNKYVDKQISILEIGYDSIIFIEKEKEKEIDRYVEMIGENTYKKLKPSDIF